MLVVVKKRTETIIYMLKELFLLGTSTISDYRASYNTLQDERHNHITVTHSMTFVGATAGDHTSTVKLDSRRGMVSSNSYRRGADCLFDVNERMF